MIATSATTLSCLEQVLFQQPPRAFIAVCLMSLTREKKKMKDTDVDPQTVHESRIYAAFTGLVHSHPGLA